MAGTSVELKLQEVTRLQQKLNSFVLSGGDKTRLLKSLGIVIEEQTKERFDTKRDPSNNQWQEITDAYRKYLSKHFPGARPPLVREGYLRNSIENQLRGSEAIIVGTAMEYADYIQNAKNEKRRREFLGFSTDNIIELEDAVDEFMKETVS
jgi:phage gpG-like protein